MGASPDRIELAEQIVKTADVLRVELLTPGEDLEHALAAARALRPLADEALRSVVAAARQQGSSWQRIGDGLGITRQAAFQRFGTPLDPRTGVAMERTVLPGAAERAVDLLDAVAAHRWEAAVAGFSPAMAAQLSPDGLADAYAAVIATGGERESRGDPVAIPMAGMTVVDVPLQHEAVDLTGRVSFGPRGDVIGLWFLPAVTPAVDPDQG